MSYKLSDLTVVDIEANGLDDASKILCVVLCHPDGSLSSFKNITEDLSERAEFLKAWNRIKVLGGHHVLGFDLPTLVRLVPGLRVDRIAILDSLVLSRLVNYKRKGGHSLEAWGESLGIQKVGVGVTDWSVLTDEILERCQSDVQINRRVFEKLWRFVEDPSWALPIRLEHFAARFCREMHETGFTFNQKKATEILTRLRQENEERSKAILAAFPPRLVLWRNVVPKKTLFGTWGAGQFKFLRKDAEYVIRANYLDHDLVIRGGEHGSDSSGHLDLGWVKGPFDVYIWEPFNPGSVKQIVERLNEAGWKPTEKTDGHLDFLKSLRDGPLNPEKKASFEKYGWKISEANLGTIPSDAPNGARLLGEYLTITSRISDLEEWLALVRDDGKIHGDFQSIGAWTHRVSHQRPNTANIPQAKPSSHDTPFQAKVQVLNGELRELFKASRKSRLVGTDADGVQMRIFAHLCGDENLIKALVEGRKEDGTDIHSLNRRLLGSVCGSRDVAKTFIYAFLLGAGAGKVAEILGCSLKNAKNAVAQFINGLPGLQELKENRIPREAALGYFVGLDGRKVICDSEHLMLAGHLQCGEKIIMTMAAEEWTERLRQEKIWFQVPNWVHDEWQTEIEDDDEICKIVQKIQCDAIVHAGEKLSLLCPLAASSDWGYTWHDTH